MRSLAAYEGLRKKSQSTVESMMQDHTCPKVEPEKLDSLSFVHDEGKPVIVNTPEFRDLNEAKDWLVSFRKPIRAAILDYGHIFLRGLPIKHTEDFAIVRDVLLAKRAQYTEKATPRSNFGDDIYSSTDLPASQSIQLHNENSYTLDFPGILAFCCLQAPSTGGATTIADVRKVLAAIPPELQARFRLKGWQLKRNYNEHISLPWRIAFSTDDRQQVNAYCERNLISANWKTAEALCTSQRRPAIICHPLTGEEVWFNHIAFWNSWTFDEVIREVLLENYGQEGLPFETFLGDGQPLCKSEVDELNQAYAVATCRESWQVGDVLIVDNILCAHGREKYTGSRRIVVAMGEPISLSDCNPVPSNVLTETY